jgi:site-specific DNA-cytosine methylase
MRITRHNFPDTIQLGDVRKLTRDMIPFDVDIIIGGSPCQNISVAGRKEGMVTNENFEITSYETYMELKKLGYQFVGESYLFWEYVRIYKMFKPKYFLLENVVPKTNDSKKWIPIISNALGVEPIQINSSLVSAQNRDRLYWTNIPNVSVPEDKEIILSDIIPGAVNGYGYRTHKKHGITIGNWSERKDKKSNCLTCGGRCDHIMFENGNSRVLTVAEYETLQTLPVGYTDVPGVSKTDRKKAIGNSWTVDVISHIFANIPDIN